MNLFVKPIIHLVKGQTLPITIDCDALTDADYKCLADIIGKKLQFKRVVSAGSGGIKLENALGNCCVEDDTYATLICGDVLTTGATMNNKKNDLNDPNVIGVVIFAVGKCPDWVMPVFTFWENEVSSTS
ncbi:MAG: hypothetical protein ABIT08_05285 [Bacteroidia bacterium]